MCSGISDTFQAYIYIKEILPPVCKKNMPFSCTGINVKKTDK